MRYGRTRLRANEGTALLVAVAYVGAVTMLAATSLTALNQAIAAAGRTESRHVAFSLAEAGIEKAVAELGAHPRTYRGEEVTHLGEGWFSVTVTPDKPQGTYRIVSTGVRGDAYGVRGTVPLEVYVRLSSDGEIDSFRWAEVK